MNDQQKKLAIVGCLVAVIACIGAFQLMGSKGPAPLPITGKESKKDEKSEAAPAAAPTGPKNPLVANELPERDPFKPPIEAALPDKVAHPAPPRPTISPLRRMPPALGAPGFSPLPPGLVGPTTLTPHQPTVQPVFAYHAVGEIGGDSPAGLFEDRAGNQKLVPVGSAIDSDSRLLGIQPDSVLVEFRGKKLRLSIGGNPVGK